MLMKKRKRITTLLMLSCIILSFTGCSSTYNNTNLKDNLIDGFDNWIQSFSKHALTKDKNLQGEKKAGEDEYTGTYEAEYNNFNGEEFIFGGTALERDKGSDLKATYTLKITSGTANLYWLTAGDEYTIASADAKDIYEFTIGSGDNYIILKGKNFSGNLILKVE